MMLQFFGGNVLLFIEQLHLCCKRLRNAKEIGLIRVNTLFFFTKKVILLPNRIYVFESAFFFYRYP